MAETFVHGRMHHESSGDQSNITETTPPPRLSPGDLISALPDAVIHHIFSFLPLLDIVRTSLLSKRWRPIWTTVADLVFDEGMVTRSRRALDFSSVVDSLLKQCASPTVNRLHVDFNYNEDHRAKLDLWLRFAEGRRVKELRLWLLLPTKAQLYVLPRFLYCWNWLVRLEVSGCCLSLGRTIQWPCLKMLVIEYVNFGDDTMDAILRGSPVLESLELRWCSAVKKLVINSTSVKELILRNFSSVETIRAQHLLSLRILGYWRCIGFRLDDISSLANAELDFVLKKTNGNDFDDERICCDVLKRLLEKLRGVPTITIGRWCLKVLSVLEMRGMPTTLSKCQNLTLHASVYQRDLLGIAYMLRSSQHLEKLVIHPPGLRPFNCHREEEFKGCCNYDEGDYWCSRKGLAKQLKTVEIIVHHFGLEHLLALLKFLLGDALVLEKMIIKAILNMGHRQERCQATILSKLLGVSQNMLSYRRASTNAEVIFSHSFRKVSYE